MNGKQIYDIITDLPLNKFIEEWNPELTNQSLREFCFERILEKFTIRPEAFENVGYAIINDLDLEELAKRVAGYIEEMNMKEDYSKLEFTF